MKKVILVFLGFFFGVAVSIIGLFFGRLYATEDITDKDIRALNEFIANDNFDPEYMPDVFYIGETADYEIRELLSSKHKKTTFKPIGERPIEEINCALPFCPSGHYLYTNIDFPIWHIATISLGWSHGSSKQTYIKLGEKWHCIHILTTGWIS